MEVFKDQTDKLIYLSPDSPNILQRLQPDHIYIIGGIADVHIKKGLTLDKAEQFNIQTASLPVKQFTKSSRTVLNINHVIEIMTNVAQDGNWEAAFAQSLPTRNAYANPDSGNIKAQGSEMGIS
jgi:tRNA (guanine9-N1)-methyltransferase